MAKTLSHSQALRYNRQIMLSGFDMEKQEILLNSSVMQVGVGGLGCAAAQYLVSAGIGEIVLVDDDMVELTNLQRQILHGEDDINKLKCVSARESLQNINSDTKIHILKKRLDSQQLADAIDEHDIDILLDCSDNLATRNQLNDASLRANIPLVSGAAIRMEGQVTSFIPGPENPCYQCLSMFFSEQELTCVEAGVMSPLVGIIGAMQALESINILSSYGDPLMNQLMTFDAKTMKWSTFKIPKSLDCPGCGNVCQ